MKATGRTIVIAVSIVLTIGIFIFDLLTPLGMAEWLLYLIPLVIASRELPRKYIYAFAAILTVFIALGFIYSPPGIQPEIALFNRSLAVGTIWIVSILLMQRKQAESKLSEQAFMLANISDAVIGFDLDYRITYYSKSAEKMYGYSAEEVMGRPSREVFQPSYLGITRERALAQLTNTGSLVVEAIHTKKDGSKVIVESHAVLLYDDYGKPIGLIGVNSDITERRHAEEKIREQATLLDKAQDAIIVRDLEHRITYWNKGAKRMYGWTADEAAGRNVIELLYKDKNESPQIIEARKTVMEQGEWKGELGQITKVVRKSSLKAT